MSRIIFLSIFLTLMLISGCRPSATREPLNTPTLDSPSPANEWGIKMTHSGGIMGLMRSIEISSDGKYMVIDERVNKTITKQLSTDELLKLQEIVSNTESISGGKLVPSACADCFIYDLEIQRDGKKNFRMRVDDISMPNSGAETLITYLRGLIDAALK